MSNDSSFPNLNLGIVYKSVTGEDLTQPLVVLSVPTEVQQAIRTVYRKTANETASLASSAADKVEHGFRLLSDEVADNRDKGLKAFGAIMTLNLDPKSIGEDTYGLLVGYVASQALNYKDDALKNPSGGMTLPVPAALTKRAAGWIVADQLQVLIWLDQENNLHGAALTADWKF